MKKAIMPPILVAILILLASMPACTPGPAVPAQDEFIRLQAEMAVIKNILLSVQQELAETRRTLAETQAEARSLRSAIQDIPRIVPSSAPVIVSVPFFPQPQFIIVRPRFHRFCFPPTFIPPCVTCPPPFAPPWPPPFPPFQANPDVATSQYSPPSSPVPSQIATPAVVTSAKSSYSTPVKVPNTYTPKTPTISSTTVNYDQPRDSRSSDLSVPQYRAASPSVTSSTLSVTKVQVTNPYVAAPDTYTYASSRNAISSVYEQIASPVVPTYPQVSPSSLPATASPISGQLTYPRIQYTGAE